MLNHVLHSGRMKHWTPNQLVSYNLIQARKLKGWVQEKAVAEVNAVEGEDAWTVATWSAAERSVDGKRVRQFSADDLVAFSRAFKLPLMWWLTPPGSDDTEVWFHLFSGYEEAKEGLAAQWAILSLLEDFSGAFTARLNRTGLGAVAREIAGAEPTVERVRYLLDLSNSLRDVADLLDTTVAGVAEAILGKSTGKEISTILDRRIAGTTDAVEKKPARRRRATRKEQ